MAENSRRDWKRHSFLNSTHCEAIVSFNTSNITQTKHTKVNISLLKAGVVTGKDSVETLWKITFFITFDKLELK